MTRVAFQLLLTELALAIGGPASGQIGGTWETLFRLDGPTASANLGYSVAGAGDVNHDGFDDVIVGAPYADPGVVVHSGPDGNLLFTLPQLGGLFGYCVAGAGDVDGDGFSDVIVGAPETRPLASAYVYSGATGTLIYQWSESGYFGGAVAGAGDLNQDGFDDLIVGAPYGNAGSVFLFSGADGSLLKRIDGLAMGDRLGYSVACIRDLDGDQVSDLLLGAYTASPGGMQNAGSVFLYSGASYGQVLIHRFDGSAAGDHFGRSVSGAGDVDGDGIEDLIIGAHEADPGGRQGSGSAFLYSGATLGLLCRLDGDAPGDNFGTSVDGGDVDRDGYAELIVGAWHASSGGPADAGSATIYRYDTATSTCALLFQMPGEATGDAFGYSVSNAGDVSGEGVDAFIVGALYANPSGLGEAGSAYVIGLNAALTASTDTLSAATGGVIEYWIDFGPVYAGVNYKLLGSATGTGPTTIGGMDVPLTSGDWLWDAMLDNPQPRVFQNGTGLLDANGRATVVLTVANQATPLIGSTFYFAAAAYRAATYTGLDSSLAVTLTITP